MSAIFSPCKTWRYRLDYDFLTQERPTIAFGLHNPSIANGDIVDPTWRRGIGYGTRWGAGKVVYVNPWAAVATKPEALWKMPDPVGPMNDFHIAAVAREVAETGGFFVFAWGAVSPPRHLKYAVTSRLHAFEKIVRDAGCDIRALGLTKAGQPRHPLYMKSAAEPVPYSVGRTPPLTQPQAAPET